jgi:hypothetical protein
MSIGTTTTIVGGTTGIAIVGGDRGISVIAAQGRTSRQSI